MEKEHGREWNSAAGSWLGLSAGSRSQLQGQGKGLSPGLLPGRDWNPWAWLASGHAGEGRGTASSHSSELTITVIQTQQRKHYKLNTN